MKNEVTKAREVMGEYDALKAERGTWDTLWQDIADYVMPRKSQITTTKTPDVVGYTDKLYNTEAIRANQVLAAGQKDYLFAGRWFAFEAPDGIEDDSVRKWFGRCTEIALAELARSNFLLCAHEMLLDRGCFGTGTLYVEEGAKNALTFTNDDIGSYVVAEDKDGLVNLVIREIELTARQAAKEFGADNLGKNLQKALEDSKSAHKKFKFLHKIWERDADDYDRNKMDGLNKPVGSCYVSVDDKVVVKEGGYDEMPYLCTRFLKWGKEPYGYSPSIEALPTVRQVNFLEKMMDALAEIRAFPRVLVPAGMDGTVDLTAGGVTAFDPNQPNAIPQEWGYQGDYNIGKDRIDSKNEAIRKAYHVDLFQMLQQIERQMTAYEVSQRMAEKIAAFSPTFYRMQVEVFTPLLNRVFSILFKAGAFPEVPSEAFVQVGPDSVAPVAPKIELTGKLAMAIKDSQNQAFLRLIEVMAPVAQMRPEIMDNYDLDKVTRGIGRNLGVPSQWELEEGDVEELRADRAQMQQQQMMLANAQAAGAAAKDLKAGGVKIA
jgi:hypothetical protein